MHWTHLYLTNKNIFNERLKDSSLHVAVCIRTINCLYLFLFMYSLIYHYLANKDDY